MSVDVAAIVERARLSAERSSGTANDGGEERRRLERIAQEFESMLLVQVLRDMRSSGAWDEEDDGETLGAETMFETIDVELASHLARVQGFGLSQQLLAAFDRMNPAQRVEPVANAGEPVAGAVSQPSPAPVAYAVGSTHASPLPPEALRLGPAESPVSGQVTSEFGWRRDPFTGQATFHRGVDLRAAYGEDVRAAGHGRVVFSGDQGGYGTTVLIEHPDGTRTRYAHLSMALVAPGDEVASGRTIGRAGRSGRATGTHVHFEMLTADGRHMDPGIARLHSAAVDGD